MTMTEAYRHERSLEWITLEFHFSGGAEMAEALRSGTRAECEAALAAMEARARAERRRGLAGHWTYQRARHVELVRIIEGERALLATKDLRTARRTYQAASRRLRWHLHRNGCAPLSLMRRLGTARGAFLAAIAGHKAGDAR
jgi:hypothetical protein